MSVGNDLPDVKSTTVFNRVFKRQTINNVYHYCSSSSLLSILQSGSIRFSDANMMNDSGEGKYAYEVFKEAAASLLASNPSGSEAKCIDTTFIAEVNSYLLTRGDINHPVIACFSKEPDVLSQWRAYAQDGEGWSIGFSTDALGAMPSLMLEVCYDQGVQLAEFRDFLRAAYYLRNKRGGDFSSAIGKEIAILSSLIYAYKHPSFKEEQEVRMIHELGVKFAGDGLMLYDEKATEGGGIARENSVKFRAAGSAIVAYVDIPFPDQTEATITELWFGPKNRNELGNAIYPLTQYGHPNARLFRSSSLYR